MKSFTFAFDYKLSKDEDNEARNGPVFQEKNLEKMLLNHPG